MKMMKNFVSMREAILKSTKHENSRFDVSNACSSRFLKKSKTRNATTPWFTTSTGELAYKRGTLNSKEKELFKWIKMIVFKNWPLASVEDSDYRSFGEMENIFSKKTVKDVIIVMARLVVELISVEMKMATRSGIIHDGWSKFGRHYVCLLSGASLIEVCSNERG